MTLSRRYFVASAALAAVVAGTRPARGQTRVRIGAAVLGDYALAGPFFVAMDRGFFSQEGLSGELVPFGGGPELAKAVVAGDVLLAAAGGTDVLVFREAGMPVKMIATHTESNHFTLNVAPEIGAVADLKGQAIGVTAVRATTWVFARLLAKQQGWELDRDVKVVSLGGLDAQVAALARKEIQAFVWGDGGALSQARGQSRVLVRLDSVTPQWISQIQYASEDGLRRNADTIRKAMRAVFRALQWMRAHPKEAVEATAGKLGWPPEAVVGAQRISGPLMSEDGTMSVEALRAMQDTLLEQGVIKKRLPLDEHYTKRFSPVRT
ncbi:MAG: ABC transporter substrate-binding protein [Candidatus Rokuibacteriota bacterium]